MDVPTLSDIVTKTNMPSKNIGISDTNDTTYKYLNVNTCKLNGLIPELDIKYSSHTCAFYGKAKIIMAHKMYGFPYYDIKGEYGICNRDSYIILTEQLGYSSSEISLLIDFLKSPFTILLYHATRYRMKYLEKYIFELLPNIVLLNRKYNIFNLDLKEDFELKTFLEFIVNINNDYNVSSTSLKYNIIDKINDSIRNIKDYQGFSL
jgi:hypothetical protein